MALAADRQFRIDSTQHEYGLLCKAGTEKPDAAVQAVVNEILQRVDQQGDIYRANYEGGLHDYC